MTRPPDANAESGPEPKAKADDPIHPPQLRQFMVYREYLRLQSLAAQYFDGSLARHLIASSGFGLKGMELAVASTMAGAAFLGIEPDPKQLKTAVRNGSCDFMVNTLDEALRTLKNELRKGNPLSVGLLGYASDILPVMVERGVQPDLISETSPLADPERYAISSASPTAILTTEIETAMAAHRRALIEILKRGARIASMGTGMRFVLAHVPAVEAESALAFDSLMERKEACDLEIVWTAASLQDLRRMDNLALALLPEKDGVRRRWLQQAAGRFYRQIPLQRVFGVLPEELPRLLDAFARSKPFQAPAAVRWQSADGIQEITLSSCEDNPTS